MASLYTFLMFTLGLIIIIKGGDCFVESAVWIAQKTGIPNVLIGATIVSIATTLPELMVSSIATYQQYYDVAIGNVIGSIVCNIGLILGLSALISPVKINIKEFSTKGYFMLGSAVLLFYMLKDTIITYQDGNLLIILFVIYIAINIFEFAKKDTKNTQLHTKSMTLNSKKEIVSNMTKFILGAVGITIGARLLVNHGVAIANLLKIPEQVISLTLIALGTSLPELVTAISSIAKKQQGISIGNILGANILDIVMVLGVSSKIGGRGIVINYQNIMIGARIYNIPQALYLDMPVALLMMIILVFGGVITKKINRPIGFMLLSIYCVYLTTLAKMFM